MYTYINPILSVTTFKVKWYKALTKSSKNDIMTNHFVNNELILFTLAM